jgi:hypothetical protein
MNTLIKLLAMALARRIERGSQAGAIAGALLGVIVGAGAAYAALRSRLPGAVFPRAGLQFLLGLRRADAGRRKSPDVRILVPVRQWSRAGVRTFTLLRPSRP